MNESNFPDRQEVPRGVDLRRLEGAARELNIPVHVNSAAGVDTELVFTHSRHARTVATLGDVTNFSVHFALTFNRTLNFDDLPQAASFINDWNSSCFSPELVVDVADPDAVTLSGHTSLVVRHGLTDAQLSGLITRAITNADAAVEEALERFPHLKGTKTGEQHPQVFGDPDDPDLSNPQPYDAPALAARAARPVDIARLTEVLSKLGITRFHSMETTGVVAWVNEILLAFLIDAGPTLVIKGHWYPNLASSEFTKLFLVANDWNRRAGAAVAYCHTDSDGLQLHMDYSVPMSGGLSDLQLSHLIAVALKDILYGIDEIARDAVGASPVEWPS